MKRIDVMVISLVLATTWGCGPSDEDCAELEQEASSHVLDLVYGDQPCTVDEDCEVVAVSGSCFDSCSGVIATANHEAFQQALDEAEADICADYDGCTLIIPPCVPPDDATCGASGQCEGG